LFAGAALRRNRFDVAEREEDGQTPGDGAQRKEVSTQPQRYGAEKGCYRYS
jgi:hypothetical protein